jgi:hypothetical protein
MVTLSAPELAAPVQEGPVSGTRVFASGATRDQDDSKLDFEGYLSPLVLEEFAKYMHKCGTLPDGSRRDSDNWQKGIPLTVYMKSMWRHFFAVWRRHRADLWGLEQCSTDDLCGLLFNVQGYLHEVLQERERDGDT